jgi:penicillin V acylase-like amidase (Ntn superfamily)
MCTRFTIPYKGGTLVARTMDFASPTGTEFVKYETGKLGYWDPLNSNVKAYNKTPVWGRATNKFGKFILCDGANQYFSVEGLWLPETKYENRNSVLKPSTDKTDALTLMNWILSGDVQDLNTMTDKLKNLKPVALFLDGLTESLATIHMSITEWITGKTIIMEIGTGDTPGLVKVYDADQTGYGVMTNSPIYRSQIDNLRGYVNLNSAANVEDAVIAGMKLHMTGNGNNLVGLPGGPLPADRFVRASILLNLATKNNPNMTLDKAKDTAAALMNTVYVVDGTTSESAMMHLKTNWDSTLWCVIKYLDEKSNVVYLHRDKAVDGFVIRSITNADAQDPEISEKDIQAAKA